MIKVAAVDWSLSSAELLLLVGGAVLTAGVILIIVVSIRSGDDR